MCLYVGLFMRVLLLHLVFDGCLFNVCFSCWWLFCDACLCYKCALVWLLVVIYIFDLLSLLFWFTWCLFTGLICLWLTSVFICCVTWVYLFDIGICIRLLIICVCLVLFRCLIVFVGCLRLNLLFVELLTCFDFVCCLVLSVLICLFLSRLILKFFECCGLFIVAIRFTYCVSMLICVALILLVGSY